MKLNLNKRNIKSLSKDKNQIGNEMTPNVAGGRNTQAYICGYTGFYYCGTSGCPSASPDCETLSCYC
ncbi:hypothetical protein ACSLBF_20220 (plasmid) [Pseudoalteromonas sp. T1lg65]|uniref:hypothetical protein n=1 Tax=Pseudoalteromonas sp. T1lg65 TaxID=2077101 RepID=UPI003F79D4ED